MKMWLKTGQEDGRGGRKGKERRWLKMWLKTGQEDDQGGRKGQNKKIIEDVAKDRTR